MGVDDKEVRFRIVTFRAAVPGFSYRKAPEAGYASEAS
jgi:hypothetical protein